MHTAQRMDKTALIRYFSKHIDLTPEELAYIADAYTFFSVKKKDFIFEHNKVCTIEAFVVSGTVRIFYLDDKGLEHVLYFAFPDWWASDMASFTTGEPALLNAQAMEDSILLIIDPERKEEMLQRIPKLERLYRIIMQRHLAVLQKRFLLTVSANAHERYLELLERSPGIEQLVPQHQIASYLGILPESLSRMKKQIREGQQ